jgi:hypothetical protein
MQRLILMAIACLLASSCSKNSAVVAQGGDPFLSEAATASGSHATFNRADASAPVENAEPFRQTASIGTAEVTAGESSLAAAESPPPDKSQWWLAQPAEAMAPTEGFKMPETSGANGRVGTVSMSYGMGQVR